LKERGKTGKNGGNDCCDRNKKSFQKTLD
jgi:hypothetical protein